MKKSFLLPILFLVGACVSNSDVESNERFSGQFLCPPSEMKKPGENGYTEEFAEFIQKIEVKKINGIDILVSSYPKRKDYPAVKMIWIMDGDWHFSKVNNASTEKVMKYKASVDSDGVIHWESQVPAYNNEQGVSFPETANSGKWWIDSRTGNKKSQANFVKGTMECRRL